MAESVRAIRQESFATADSQVAQLRRDAPGWLTSALLHGLALAMILLLMNEPPRSGQSGTRFVPVTLVAFGGSSGSPRAGKNVAPLKSSASTPSHREASVRKPSRVGISRKITPNDQLDAKLENLSKLTQLQSVGLPSVNDFAASESGEGGEGKGEGGPYGVRDLVRAQVLRRWSLNLETLGARNFNIPIRVKLTPTGRVLKAEIVDHERFRRDKIYRDIAISARNAVVLSSPLTLPSGRYEDVFQMIVLLNPMDTQK